MHVGTKFSKVGGERESKRERDSGVAAAFFEI